MKSILFSLLISATASAHLSRDMISNVGVSLYGVYMTSDASCQNSLIASMPLSKTPITSNFVKAPVLGAGNVPSKIACVVLVLGNKIQVDWQSKNYSAPDNVCSAGGTAPVSPCVNAAVTWPAAVIADAKAIGLTLSLDCPISPTGGEIVPIFMSVNSSCTGNSVVDQNIKGCTSLGKSTSAVSQSPLTTNSKSGGARIPLTEANGRIIFAVDPDQIVSGSTGSCLLANPPVFSIHQ